ncbi:MAG: hypothetical protein FWG70_10660 [Oscillospiraceae bacterium]|nr:hypothetical protein [Oscillospiraceae bacterium]
MKHFFVINSHSFRTSEKLKAILKSIEDSFSSTVEYEIYKTRFPRDAIAAVHRFISRFPKDETIRVYAVGGDGILFECLNGMVDFPNAELTSVPYGRANDFVRAFGKDAAASFRDIKKLSVSPSRPVDIMHCGSGYALIEVNIGLVGKTIVYANEVLCKIKSEFLSRYVSGIYTVSALKALRDPNLVHQKYSVFIDGEPLSGTYCNIHIANVPCDGGNFVPSPYADPTDGALDAIFMTAKNQFEVLRLINDRNKGRFEKHDSFIYRKCEQMQVKSDALLCVQLDGEGFYESEFNIEIIPGGIKFFAPTGLDFKDYSYMAYKSGKGGKKV